MARGSRARLAGHPHPAGEAERPEVMKVRGWQAGLRRSTAKAAGCLQFQEFNRNNAASAAQAFARLSEA
jgi:hypothetical protein